MGDRPLSLDEIHVQNEHRFTRLELLVMGLYFVVLGEKIAPMLLPAFLSVVGL